MKIIRVIVFMCCSILTLNSFAQDSSDNQEIKDLNLVISKLVIHGNDLTDSLRIVNISKGIWLERNKDDREIGRGNIVKNKDNEIHVKWMSVANGARKHAVTIYRYKRNGEKYTFEIYYNDVKQGYFLGKSYDNSDLE